MKKVLKFGALVLLAGASIYNLTLQADSSDSFGVQLNHADALAQGYAQKVVDVGKAESFEQWGDNYVWSTWDYEITSCSGNGNVSCSAQTVITNRKWEPVM